MKTLSCPRRARWRVPDASFATASTTPTQEAPSIHLPELREDILREHRRHTLPSTPTSSRDLRRSRLTQRGGPEQVCHRSGKADRLNYRRSLARKGRPFVLSVQRSENSNSRNHRASG